MKTIDFMMLFVIGVSLAAVSNNPFVFCAAGWFLGRFFVSALDRRGTDW